MSLTPRIDRTDINYIINGNFDYWQRGISSSSAGYVTADRWYIANSGGIPTSSRQSDGTQYFLRCVKGAATLIDIRQGIELPIVGTAGDFTPGSKFTICFDAKSAVGGESLIADAFFRIGVATGTATNISSAGSVTLTTSWQRYSLTYTVNASPGGSDLGFFIKLTTTATQLDIKKIALYKGEYTSAPDFIRAGKTLGGELQLCQRYYEVMTISLTGYNASGNSYVMTLPFKVEKRADPTPTKVTAGNNIVGSGFAVEGNSTNTTCIGLSSTGTGERRELDMVVSADAEL